MHGAIKAKLESFSRRYPDKFPVLLLRLSPVSCGIASIQSVLKNSGINKEHFLVVAAGRWQIAPASSLVKGILPQQRFCKD